MYKKVVIVGPSGSGKTKIGNEVFRDILGWVTFITHSTRDMREGEVQNKSYHFVSNEEFFKVDKIEYTEYPKNSNQYYGLSVKEVKEKSANNDCYCVMDINGALALKKEFPDTKVIFVYSPIEVLEERMRNRGDNEDKIQQRLKNIEEANEMANLKYADFVVENLDFEDTKNRIMDYISKL